MKIECFGYQFWTHPVASSGINIASSGHLPLRSFFHCHVLWPPNKNSTVPKMLRIINLGRKIEVNDSQVIETRGKSYFIQIYKNLKISLIYGMLCKVVGAKHTFI